ncbi:hypothetical protein BCR35DRAFT_167056 [Leucosporidium creatinivorum]|uniref:Uncharacterized protein n=1 Tax=Leucosporidium creatinivorum TaxID=106004 RepID=A0A1Y2EIK5_9BASI|nr:hypothetical protein BCR35DRAFT_167056 [Leucosporidium creatinivorum]
MEHTSPRSSPAPAHLQQSTPARPLLAGDALLQARIKAALDSVKLALHDFKDELHESTKLGTEVAGLRGDLAGLRAAWDQQALDSSEKLHQKLEATLTTTLSSTLTQLGSTASSLTSSLTSVSSSINDSETRSANLLSNRFASLQDAQSSTTEAVRTFESRFLTELQKVKSGVLSELQKGSAGDSDTMQKLDELSKDMGEVLARQQEILDGVELAKGRSEEVEALKDRLDRLEKERQEDRQVSSPFV